MAGSDNVLRGGLTGKYVDLAALMEVLDFTDGKVPVLQPVPGPGGLRYPVPVEDFDLTRADVRADAPAVLTTPGPQVVLCTEGRVALRSADGELELEKGRSAFVPAGVPVDARGDGTLFRATTNLA